MIAFRFTFSVRTAVLLLSIFFTGFQLFGQCNNTSAWGGADAPTDGDPAVINNCNYAGEFATVTNIVAGNEYVITSSDCNDYITVYDDSNNLVGSGNTPFIFNALAAGNHSVHFNTGPDCGSDGNCRITAIHCISCGATGGCTNTAASNYDPSASYEDCSCVLPSLAYDNCPGAMNLDTWLNMDATCIMTSTSTYSGATPTMDEVAPSATCSDGDSSPKDVWYSLTVPPSGVITFKFMDTPGFSSIVECYTGTCGDLTAYTPANCNNDSERIFDGLVPGTTIYFRVWDYGSNDVGDHELCVRSEITGCTDPDALNYNPDATYDDGTCSFPSASKPCTAPFLTINDPCLVGDNTGIDTETGEPLGTCFEGDNHPVWYRFVAQHNYTTISTDFSGYTNADTEVAVYSADDCSDYPGFVLMACNQDGGITDPNHAILSNVATNIGNTYYIQVSGKGGMEGSFCITATDPPANNRICGAQAVTCGETVNGNTLWYGMDVSDLPVSACGTGLNAPNAYYWLEGSGNDVLLSMCNSDYDTRLSVYCLMNGSCGDTPEFICVGSNDDSPACVTNSRSAFRFATEAGGKYYIMVHGYGSNTGNFELTVDCSPAASAPLNQDCENNGLACRPMGTAEEITPVETCNMVLGNNEAASSAIQNPPCVASANQTHSDVWYRFNTGIHTAFEVDVQGGTAVDVRHALYDQCGGTSLYCDQNILMNLDASTDYYLQVFTSQGNEGSFQICVKTLDVCAILNNPSGNEVDVNEMLEWSNTSLATGYQIMIGTTDGGNEFMSLTDVGNSLSYPVSGLDYNITYYVTIQPYDDSGPIAGCPSFSFMTTCPVLNSNLVALTENNCYGMNDAGLDVSAGGGVGPYGFDWSGPNGYSSSSEDISFVAAGEYTVVVTDMDNGCQSSFNYNIPQAAAMTALTDIVDAGCADDGTITIVPSGGIEPYSYLWSVGSTASEVTDLPAGTYSVEVTDGEGCMFTFDNLLVEKRWKHSGSGS